MNDDELRAAYERHLTTRASTSRAGCPSADALLAVAERTGPESERLTTMDHAMSCRYCREELAMLRLIAAAGGEKRAPGVFRWPSNVGRLAAAAAVFVVLGSGAAVLLSRGDGGEVVRGGPGEVVLVAPVGALRPVGPVRFIWRAMPGAVRYEAELLRGDGVAVYGASTIDTSMTLPASVALDAGREYVWSVSARRADGTQAASAPARFLVQP